MTNYTLLNKMSEIYPLMSRLIFFLYNYIFQMGMVNLFFIIFLRAYNKVKVSVPVSALSFNLLFDGLIEFLKNIYLKYFPDLNKLNEFFD
jgi:hypothetical protein